MATSARCSSRGSRVAGSNDRRRAGRAAQPGPALPEPIDWALAGRIARRVSGRDPLATSYLAGSLASDFAEVTAQAEALVADFTGSRSPSPGACHRPRPRRAGSTPTSVDAQPARAAHRPGRASGSRRSPFAPIGRTVTATELGVLLGWFSQRVLGQYDLLVPADDDAGALDDAVYYVGANVLGAREALRVPPRDFRLWIALHECTHRAQFTGVPWLRPYFLSLVNDLLGVDRPRPEARRARGARRARRDAARVATRSTTAGSSRCSPRPSTAARSAQVQSLMTLLEGHGNA